MVVSNTPEYAMLLIFKTFKGWRVRQVGGLASTRAFPLKPLQSFIIWLFSILRKELWFLKPDFGKTPTSSQVVYRDWIKPFGKWVTPLPSMPPPIFLDSDSFSYPALSPLTVDLRSIKNLEKTSPTFYPKSEVQFSRQNSSGWQASSGLLHHSPVTSVLRKKTNSFLFGHM